MAELELSVLTRQALGGRIPDLEILRRRVQSWQVQRNQRATSIDWRFTTEDARIKLKKLYPTIHVS